ncbi:MAG: peptidoglycan DD-metalloendopeptidase family protein [Mobilitalea sp.]
MKKNKFTEFFKGKGYYVLLFVGVVAIATVAIIGSQLSSDQKDQGDSIVDLNAPDDNIAAVEDGTEQAENNPVSEGIVNNANNSANDTAAKDNSGQDVASNEDLIEYEGDYGEINVPVLPEATVPEVVAEVVEEKPDAVETTGTTVQADTTSVTDSLNFKADEGLLWPVKGDVIMNYSMDHTIYHATLMQYKCNPAIIIDAEVGTEVMAAANGIVSSIDTDNEETGFTITMNIGDGYSVVYGQLGNVGLEVGDKVNEGDVIGTVDEPTKYYTIEGSNLYFEVLENEQTINPMLLLR